LVKRKKRYIIVETSSNIPLDVFRKLVEKSYLELFGEFGLIQANVKVVKKIDSTFVLECSHGSVPKLILSLSSITRLEEGAIRFRVVKIAGTVKKVREIIVGE